MFVCLLWKNVLTVVDGWDSASGDAIQNFKAKILTITVVNSYSFSLQLFPLPPLPSQRPYRDTAFIDFIDYEMSGFEEVGANQIRKDNTVFKELNLQQ